MGDTYPSLGVLIGLPIAALFTLLSLILIAVGIRKRIADGEFELDEPAGWLVGIGAGMLVVTLGLTAVAMWPWSTEYHQWRPVGGTVDVVQSRLISAGDKGGTDQKFVVRFTSSKQEYSCEDTRCALLKPGQHLDLSCKRSWQYAGTSGFDCQYVRADGDQ